LIPYHTVKSKNYAGGKNHSKKKREKLRRQGKPLPILIKEKEPLWYRVPPPKEKLKDQWGSGGL
jgi:hypothetical protein